MFSGLVLATGLPTLAASPRDVKLLCLMRLVRLAAYGASTLVLVSLLGERGASKTQTGLFMTLTLAGDVAISLVATAVADGVGRRLVLAVGAALMVASGAVFVLFDNFWALLAAAVLGVISPSGNEIGPFRAIEESIVAHLTASADRGAIYAWYSLLGPAGTALGFFCAGWTVHHAVEARQWAEVDAYRLIFVLYATLGILKLFMVLSLSARSEADADDEESGETTAAATTSASEGAGVATTVPTIVVESEEEQLLSRDPDVAPDGQSDGNGTFATGKVQDIQNRRGLLPSVNRETAGIVGFLCILFGLDSFASGMTSMSWITFFYKWKYNLEEGRLGSVFFVTSIISALSIILAVPIAKQVGNVKTMVFTHFPSSIFLGLIPLPSTLGPSLVFLVLRACTQSMDTAPRSAFLAGALKPTERTATMGLLNIVRTTAQLLSPLLTGVLVDNRLFWVAFVVSSACKCTYDIGMLAVFGGRYRRRGHGDEAGRTDGTDECENGRDVANDNDNDSEQRR